MTQNRKPTGSTARWIRRIGIVMLLSILVLVVAGLVYESLAAATARRNFPPPGQLVDAGGYRLHLHTMGQKQPGMPTVLLEHGGTGMSLQWGWVQPALAQHTQVVAYDRPGLGWSEAPPTRINAETAVRDFYTALQTAGIEGPYVLVGHSMGGLMVRVFAQLYPEETAGLVLVDPVTVERHELLPYGMDPVSLGLIQTLARLGVLRLSGLAAQEAAGLPEPQFQQGVALFPAYQHLRGWGQEGHLGETALEFLRTGEPLDAFPVIVLEAGAADGAFDPAQREVLHELYQQLVTRASEGHQRVVEGAGHVTIVTHETHAQAIIDAVLDLLPGARRSVTPS